MADRGTSQGDLSSADWDVPHIDVDIPNSARIYDWLLGGGHNFDADRQLAKRLVQAFPTLPNMVQHTRKWLRRAVHAMVTEHGVDQFLDLGSGLPSMGYTHEVALALNPDVRVLYVDNDSIAVAHSKHIACELDGVTAIEGDFTNPKDVLSDPATGRTLDFDRPIAVIFSCSLHLIPDDKDPWRTVGAYRDATTKGSLLAISHSSKEAQTDKALVDTLLKDGSHPFIARSHEQVARMFEGYEMLEPGLTNTAQWRPDFGIRSPTDDRSGCHAGVGIKVG